MATTTQTRTPQDAHVGVRPGVAISALAGLTALSVLIQGLIAGGFIDRDDRDGWITVHGINADIGTALALITAIVAFRRFRSARNAIVALSGALFAALLLENGLGHLITDYGYDWVIMVHVPVAMAVFGLAIWLIVRVAAANRGRA